MEGKEKVGAGMEVQSGYNVVFRAKSTGVVTWSTYDNEAEFQADLKQLIENYDIVDVGKTDKECVALSGTTPPEAYVKAARMNATMPDGTVDRELLKYEMINAAYAISRRD